MDTSTSEAVRIYKAITQVERAFRPLKTVGARAAGAAAGRTAAQVALLCRADAGVEFAPCNPAPTGTLKNKTGVGK